VTKPMGSHPFEGSSWSRTFRIEGNDCYEFPIDQLDLDQYLPLRQHAEGLAVLPPPIPPKPEEFPTKLRNVGRIQGQLSTRSLPRSERALRGREKTCSDSAKASEDDGQTQNFSHPKSTES